MPSSPEVVETATATVVADKELGHKLLNQYIVYEQIGKGMHGKVRRGKDTITGEDVAIKIVDRVSKHRGLPSSLRASPSMINTTEKGIRREIAIMKKCHHKHVVRLREVIDDKLKKKIFLVLEYMKGGEVKWRTSAREPVLTVEQACSIFRGVVLGLDYLHYQGIIHRDIKPANLLMDSGGNVKISDFGVSHFSYALRLAAVGEADEETKAQALMDDQDLAKTAGSPAFYAPELCYQGNDLSALLTGSGNIDDPVTGAGGPHARDVDQLFQKKPIITKAIDVWALGVTLYCLLFGRTPFDGANQFVLYQIIPKEDYEIPETMGSDALPTNEGEGLEVVGLLGRLMEKDPAKRITLKEVKQVPWVQRGIEDPEKWIQESAPDRKAAVLVSAIEADGAITQTKKRKRLARHLTSQFKWFKGFIHPKSSPGTPEDRHSHGQTPALRLDTSVIGSPAQLRPSSASRTSSDYLSSRPGNMAPRSRGLSPLGLGSRTPRSKSPGLTSSPHASDSHSLPPPLHRRSAEPDRLVSPTRTSKPRSSSTSLLSTPQFSTHLLRAQTSNVSIISTSTNPNTPHDETQNTGVQRRRWKTFLPFYRRRHGLHAPGGDGGAGSDVEHRSGSEGPPGSPTAMSTISATFPLTPTASSERHRTGESYASDIEFSTDMDEEEEEVEEDDLTLEDWSEDDSLGYEDPNHAVSMFGAGGLAIDDKAPPIDFFWNTPSPPHPPMSAAVEAGPSSSNSGASQALALHGKPLSVDPPNPLDQYAAALLGRQLSLRTPQDTRSGARSQSSTRGSPGNRELDATVSDSSSDEGGLQIPLRRRPP